jgi:hypothetical protein
MTDVDRKNIDLVDADRSRRRPTAVTGRDIVAALASSPLAAVQFDRLTINSQVREIRL